MARIESLLGTDAVHRFQPGVGLQYCFGHGPALEGLAGTIFYYIKQIKTIDIASR